MRDQVFSFDETTSLVSMAQNVSVLEKLTSSQHVKTKPVSFPRSILEEEPAQNTSLHLGFELEEEHRDLGKSCFMDWEEARAVPKSFTGGLRLKQHHRPSSRGLPGSISLATTEIVDRRRVKSSTFLSPSRRTSLELRRVDIGDDTFNFTSGLRQELHRRIEMKASNFDLLSSISLAPSNQAVYWWRDKTIFFLFYTISR